MGSRRTKGLEFEAVRADAASAELSYTQQMLRELRDMAQGRQDDMLAYLLEMAYVHCSDELRGWYPDGAKRKALSDV